MNILRKQEPYQFQESDPRSLSVKSGNEQRIRSLNDTDSFAQVSFNSLANFKADKFINNAIKDTRLHFTNRPRLNVFQASSCGAKLGN